MPPKKAKTPAAVVPVVAAPVELPDSCGERVALEVLDFAVAAAVERARLNRVDCQVPAFCAALLAASVRACVDWASLAPERVDPNQFAPPETNPIAGPPATPAPERKANVNFFARRERERERERERFDSIRVGLF